RLPGDVANVVRNPGGALRNLASRAEGWLDGLSGGGGNLREEMAQRAAERKAREAKERSDKVKQKLSRLVQAINSRAPIEKKAPGPKGRGTASELHLAFEHASAGLAKDSTTDAVLALIVRSSGQTAKGHAYGSGVQSATIKFTGLFGKT